MVQEQFSYQREDAQDTPAAIEPSAAVETALLQEGAGAVRGAVYNVPEDELPDHADFLAKLRHPRIPDYLGTRDVGHGRTMVVESVPVGKSLEALLEARQQLPWREVVEVMRDLIGTLSYLHTPSAHGKVRYPIIHGAITPRNVIREPDGDHILTGFEHASIGERENTPDFSVQGIPGFRAPEQLVGAAYRETDIYGLGALAYVLLGGDPEELEETVIRDEPVDVPDSWELPRVLKRVLERMLDHDVYDPNRAVRRRDCRYQTLREVMGDLRRLSFHMDVPVVDEEAIHALDFDQLKDAGELVAAAWEVAWGGSRDYIVGNIQRASAAVAGAASEFWSGFWGGVTDELGDIGSMFRGTSVAEYVRLVRENRDRRRLLRELDERVTYVEQTRGYGYIDRHAVAQAYDTLGRLPEDMAVQRQRYGDRIKNAATRSVMFNIRELKALRTPHQMYRPLEALANTWSIAQLVDRCSDDEPLAPQIQAAAYRTVHAIGELIPTTHVDDLRPLLTRLEQAYGVLQKAAPELAVHLHDDYLGYHSQIMHKMPTPQRPPHAGYNTGRKYYN